MNNFLTTGVVAIIGGVVAGALMLTFVHNTTTIQQLAGASAAGTTFNTAKIASISMAPQTVTSTSTSILNGDANDRIVLDAGVGCQGLGTMLTMTGGTDALHWYAGTSSSAAPTSTIAAAALLAMNVTVATSSTVGFTATSTYTSPFARIWNAGSYMIFQTNATNTTATCTPFVHYIGT